MTAPFRFETILRIREAERDRCRMALARAQQHEARLLAEHRQTSIDRLAVLDDLRAMQDRGDWTAEQAMVRQTRAEYLAIELSRIDIAIKDATAAVEQCRSNLLEVDTSVKALEKLAGRHESAQRQAEQRSAERDRDDAWRAA